MGRRRSKRKPAPKRRQDPLDKQFNCPFCNHEKSCEVRILEDLSEPVDVYSDWIDACESANQ